MELAFGVQRTTRLPSSLLSSVQLRKPGWRGLTRPTCPPGWRQGKPEPPLTPGEADEAALIAFKALEMAPPHSLLPEEGQNLRLLLGKASMTRTRASSNC